MRELVGTVTYGASDPARGMSIEDVMQFISAARAQDEDADIRASVTVGGKLKQLTAQWPNSRRGG